MTFETAKYYYDYYCNGYSSVKLANEFGHTPQYYIHGFKTNGFSMRSNKLNSRRYSADFEYFENIDTAEKAYWLGLISSDGYISSANGKRLGISLSNKDANQIEKFANCIQSTYPIHTYKVKQGYKPGIEYCRLVITSDKLYDDLERHGVCEHKSNILKRPDIDPKFYSQYILGYFDGDGSIFCNNSRSPFYTVSIVGTDDVLTFIHSQFVENGITDRDVSLSKRKPNQAVSYIRYGGNRIVSRIYSYLYRDIDTAIPLERKRELFLKCLNRNFQ